MKIRAASGGVSRVFFSCPVLVACLAGWPAAQAALAPANHRDFHKFAPVSGSPLTGIWQPDARALDPRTVTDGINGRTARPNWSLFVADLHPGGVSTLVDYHWEMDGASVVPEVSTWFTGAGALAILLCFAWSVHSQGSDVIRIGNGPSVGGG